MLHKYLSHYIMIKTINNSIKSTVQEKSECKYSDKN